jgi:hypothetical protein
VARHQLRPGNRVRISGRFDDGSIPVGASVEVRRADGSLLTEGQLDDRGLFYFGFTVAGALKVIVDDEQGHHKEVRIEASELAEALLRDGACRAAVCLVSPLTTAAVLLGDGEDYAPGGEPVSDHGGVSILRVLIGVGILLGLAALAVGMQKWRAGSAGGMT